MRRGYVGGRGLGRSNFWASPRRGTACPRLTFRASLGGVATRLRPASPCPAEHYNARMAFRPDGLQAGILRALYDLEHRDTTLYATAVPTTFRFNGGVPDEFLRAWTCVAPVDSARDEERFRTALNGLIARELVTVRRDVPPCPPEIDLQFERPGGGIVRYTTYRLVLKVMHEVALFAAPPADAGAAGGSRPLFDRTVAGRRTSYRITPAGIAVLDEAAPAPKSSNRPSRAPRARCEPKLTDKRQRALTMRMRGMTFTAIGEALGVTRQTATLMVKHARAIVEAKSGKSVRARQTLPADRRGQADVADERDDH